MTISWTVAIDLKLEQISIYRFWTQMNVWGPEQGGGGFSSDSQYFYFPGLIVLTEVQRCATRMF